MSSDANSPLPTLEVIGRDLLALPRWRVALSLIAPFAFAAGYFFLAFAGLWPIAVASVIALSFVTYGSISHDLVHRTLGLPKRLNDALLTAIEMLMLRSGRAYRLAHLNHHARYPSAHDDPEAAAAHGGFWSALASGPFFFIRLWCWAVRRHPAHRPRMIAEATVLFVLVAGACAVANWSIVPLIYVLLAYLGTWVVPLATAYIPHMPGGSGPLTQTRRFRGRVARWIALDHLYHLEHHLYPSVPHHRWPELANRLNPYLDRAGVPVVRLGN